jgi:aldose sugar dehydrogenase
MMTRIALLLCLTLLAPVQPARAAGLPVQQSREGIRFRVETVVQDLGVPWGMAFLNPSEIIFTEREGRINVLDLKTESVTPVSGTPAVYAEGQGGMLDVAVPPGFKPGDWVYFTYSKPVKGRGATTLARARRKGNRLVAWQDLKVTRSATRTDRHFGSRIAFDGAGHLFFSIGDRGERPNAQNLSNHAGSILRLNLDGSVPSDNPFAGRAGALPEIWSFGHRNPQGICFDAAGQRLWSIEHGPRGGDEINRIRPGLNYGWPVVSHGKEYWGPVRVGEGTEKAGMEPAVKVYIPSIAPGSLILYSGSAFAAWKGNLFSGALALTHLNRVVVDGAGRAVAEERFLDILDERIRALAESPEGFIYFSTDSGQIFRMVPADGR